MPLRALDAAALKRLRYRGDASPIVEFAALLELVAGREPLLVEIKSEWDAADPRFLQAIAALSTAYRGPLALMSFDPAVMTAIRELAPGVPRGIVSGLYEGQGWWRDKLDDRRAFALSHFLKSRPVAPDFYAYRCQSAADAGDAVRARGAGALAVHLDGADAGAARDRRAVGERTDFRGIRALRWRAWGQGAETLV